jgi:hypothetical protein
LAFDTREFAKKNFDHTYNCEDPRPYFTTLRPLDYRIHRDALPLFEECARTLARACGVPRITMVDLCTGYGINAAMMRHSVGLDDLYDLYDLNDCRSGSPQSDLPSRLERDRRFFVAKRLKGAPVGKIVGIDKAERAVHYAEAVGLLDHGAAEDLEQNEPSARFRAELADVALITVTGGMGYIGARTFERILKHVRSDRRPWIVAFPLLTVAVGPLRRMFARFGLQTEIWERDTFPQRQFASQSEKVDTENRLREIGAPKRDRGNYMYSRMILARPDADAQSFPIDEIMAKPRRIRKRDRHDALEAEAML